MADKTIGELPSIANVSDASLIPVEQNGAAGKMTGQQFREWAEQNVASYQQAAEEARDQAVAAGTSAVAAEQAIIDMGATATTLAPGSSATVTKLIDPSGAVTLEFGLPQGATGATGATGAQGPQGVGGLAVPTDSQYAFTVDENGHLICAYTGDTAPAFQPIGDDGHLYLLIS